MSKDTASLAQSKANKDSIKEYFTGEPPESVMKADWNDRSIDRFIVGASDLAGSFNPCPPETCKCRVAGHRDVNCCTSKAGDMSFAGIETMSRFPVNIGRKLLLWYSKEGDTVLDPFMGHNSRMELCIKAGRHYKASDIQPDYVSFTQEVYNHPKHGLVLQGRLGETWPSAELVVGDSRNLPFASDSCDFMITSPPYWDCEFYGDQPEQLYYSKTYEQFLNGLMAVFAECHRVLRPGAFGAVFVNDFRRDGTFYPYHADCIQRFPSIGFINWDMAIVDLGQALRKAWLSQTLQQQILPKRHEFALIVRKPPRQKERSAYDRRTLEDMPEPPSDDEGGFSGQVAMDVPFE